MRQNFGISFWKAIPFLRILVPFVVGILLQFYLPFSPVLLIAIFLLGVGCFLFVLLLRLSRRFMLNWIAGLGVNLIFFSLGAGHTYQRNITNDDAWVGANYSEGKAVMVTLLEPLVERPRSWKALAKIERVIGDSTLPVKGNLLVYFQKDSLLPIIGYGSQLIISRPLQPIVNSGNPGGFDYEKYCAFRDIHQQVFLKTGDYTIANNRKTSWFKICLFETKAWVLSVLRRFIRGKDESAVAEALLIGYREDLDKELVQSYSNTGVVHIIAISGLHLGMIYGVLLWLFHPFRRRKWARVIRPIFILLVLWMFTFIAGAVPSIMRSAVMFSCIIAGEALSKRSVVYNTLAVSAFVLLAIDPFYLWDVGFQLSFAAVLSIVAFSKHVANWCWFRNRILNGLWRMSAVTLAAQVLTLPLVLYHFHQFPNLFMFTNILVVPLSGLILFAEIFLLLFTPFPALANAWGDAISWSLSLMNDFIRRTDSLPFAVTDGIQLTTMQALVIYVSIIFAAAWLLNKRKPMLMAALSFFVVYLASRGVDVAQVNAQRKLIVYNISRYSAMDIIEGVKYQFYGDSSVYDDALLVKVHLKPSRTLHRISPGQLRTIKLGENMISSGGKRVLILNGPVLPSHGRGRQQADVVVITGNPRLYIDDLRAAYDFPMVVFDASNPAWKIRLWKKDCDSLHLRHHSVPEQGAFVMDL